MLCDTGGAQKYLLSPHLTPPEDRARLDLTFVEAAAITCSAWETGLRDSIGGESNDGYRTLVICRQLYRTYMTKDIPSYFN